MTASWDDEKLASLVGEGGDSGLALYGAFWRLAEIVAAQMDGKNPSCSLSYPVWRWAQRLSIRKSYLSSILLRLQKEGLVVLEGDPKCDQTVIVKMPNLLKYRDEYSKKSRQTPVQEGDTEGDTEGEQIQIEKEPESLPMPENLPAMKSAEVVEIWNASTRGKLPQAKSTLKRQAIIQTRLKESGWIEDFRRACEYLAHSDWHCGANDRKWVATIDFALQYGKATELAEKAGPVMPQVSYIEVTPEEWWGKSKPNAAN